MYYNNYTYTNYTQYSNNNTNLNMLGYYEINFTGIVATATTAVNIGVVMTENGTEKENTKSV